MLKIKYVATELLQPYKNNSRTHSENQIKQIVASVREFGFTNPILIDENHFIIAGHGRLLAAELLGIDKVPTITLEGLSEAQRKAYVIADNKIALNAGWDNALLLNEVFWLKEFDFNIASLGFSEVELEGLLDADIDYSLLDEIDDDEIGDFEENVKKAIQIEFESENYEEAKELISFWREKGAYIGYMIIDALRKEKQRL